MILSKYYIILGGQRVVNPRGSLVFPSFGEMMDGRYFLFSMPREGDVGAGRGGEVLRCRGGGRCPPVFAFGDPVFPAAGLGGFALRREVSFLSPTGYFSQQRVLGVSRHRVRGTFARSGKSTQKRCLNLRFKNPPTLWWVRICGFPPRVRGTSPLSFPMTHCLCSCAAAADGYDGRI